MINLKIYKAKVLKNANSFKNKKMQNGKYHCDNCGVEVAEGYAMRSYELHNKKVLCMDCHLKLRQEEKEKLGITETYIVRA